MGKTTKQYRDADTGQYVTKSYADKNPKTTVSETSKHSKPNTKKN
ncbi:MAG: hypothetical protein PHV37_01100 [Candidatus Gastranaerophilales bacterium]|nr:hypothetical protein [Candidatus Gastranaerophilales bacterium]